MFALAPVAALLAVAWERLGVPVYRPERVRCRIFRRRGRVCGAVAR